jgi:hypothetical protein
MRCRPDVSAPEGAFVKAHRIAPGFLAVLTACLALPVTAGETGGTYTYTDLAVPDGTCVGMIEVGTESQFPASVNVVIDTHPNPRRRAPRGTYFGCHSGTVLLECEDTLYYCFRTVATHFAVPKKRGLQVGQRWATMDTTFEVIRTEQIAYLGTRHETLVIATPIKPDGTSYFYWSEDAGLLAMRDVTGREGEEDAVAMVLEGARGFPF